MIEVGDPVAIELFNKYNQNEMQDWNYSESEIIELLTYISGFGSAETIEEITLVDDTEKDSVQVLLKKLDEILRYYKDKNKKSISEKDINTGKGLFTGKLQYKNNAEACVNCHNIEEIDTLNWNPSAYEISVKFEDNFKELMRKPVSQKMRETLKEHELTNLEIDLLSYYIGSVKENGLILKKKINWRKYIVFCLLLVIALSVIDLKVKKVILPNRLHFIIILISVIYLIRELYIEASSLSLTKNYEPEQPIKFSHKIHAGDNGTNCLYCHSSAEESKVAGIPTVNVCMNCHKVVRSGTNSGKFEIDKIYTAINTNSPIEWVKVSNLADHVFFSHAQHVTVGRRECQDCHGKVEEMHIVKQIEDLSMGWCLDCHRKTLVQQDSNEYYKALLLQNDKLDNTDNNQFSVEDLGGNECQKCHY
jgi:hypothetical protein